MALVSAFQANDRNFLALFKRKANLLSTGKLESATTEGAQIRLEGTRK